MHIASVKFATQFKESPCSPVVTSVPSFSSEGHGVQTPAEGLQIFLAVFVFVVVVVFFLLLSFCFVLKRLNNELNKNSITDARSVIFS